MDPETTEITPADDHGARIASLEAHYSHLAEAQAKATAQVGELAATVDSGFRELRDAITLDEEHSQFRQGRFIEKYEDVIKGQSASQIDNLKSKFPQPSHLIGIITVFFALISGAAVYIGLQLGPIERDISRTNDDYSHHRTLGGHPSALSNTRGTTKTYYDWMNGSLH